VSPATGYFDRIAADLLAAHPAPDLRAAIVILPNYHVAQPLAQALARAAKVPALLLPRMTTLTDWVRDVTPDAQAIPDSRRGALLYQHLHQKRWFGRADLWGITQELLKLFDELTNHALDALAVDEDTFAAAVERAYAARQNESLQLEARLVFELWHAMQQDATPDSARVYQQRLAALAAKAERPLYVLRTSDWDALEERFLKAYSRRATVRVFDLRRGKPGEFYFGENGENTRPSLPRFFPATSLEQEARAAAMQVRLWLAEGKRDIAIVAQDRVTARRARALLERDEVLVRDETGWTFATLSVSAALDRWLTALQSGFYHHDLLDLLKSPFIFADLIPDERKAAVHQLEQWSRKHGIVAGLDAFDKLATTEPHPMLARLRKAAALLEQHHNRTLTEWLRALRESMAELSMDIGLAKDDAGARLLQALDDWQQELADDNGRYRFAEWRRWLAQRLDTTTYIDTRIDSSVRFTHLAATRWRAFDAVLLLGCDADHLPGDMSGGRWFNDAVRGILKLPTRASRAARQHDDLIGLLTLNDCVLATWQQERDGESGLLSPWLQLLRDQSAVGEGGENTHPHPNPPLEGEGIDELIACLALEDARRIDLPITTQPAPSVPPARMPERISVGAYNTLVACPYQFFARHLLRLNELDEVQEDIQKRDYGDLVHAILQRFHQSHPRVSKQDDDTLRAALQHISEEAFADLIEHDFAARAWLARWLKTLPAYLEWQRNNEQHGWHYAESERGFERQLASVVLRGRIDRLDEKDGATKVFDYKTQTVSQLTRKLKDAGEDVQLACYAEACDAAEAAFISLDGDTVREIAPPQELAQLAQRNAERLTHLMQRLRDGANLPANGIEQTCQYCEMRGLCRKGDWQNG
jgi:ATP-dependent helicase/nuclease subunit B